MVLHLAEQLDVPLRERNALLLAAGYAPVFAERALDEPEMAAVRDGARPASSRPRALPGGVVDRHWDLVAANRGVALLTDGRRAASCSSRRSTCCALSLHPDGLAPRIANLARVARAPARPPAAARSPLTGDPALAALLRRALARYPRRRRAAEDRAAATRSPCRCGCAPATPCCAFLSTVTTFGTARRHHRRRAVDRVVLPGRRGDGARRCGRSWTTWAEAPGARGRGRPAVEAARRGR